MVKKFPGIPECQVAIVWFPSPCCYGHLWINIRSFYNALNLNLYPGTGPAWFSKREPTWRQWAEELDLGASAVRGSLCYDSEESMSKQARNGDVRCLPFPSVNLSMLLVILGRGYHGKNKRGGRVEHESTRIRFKQLLDRILGDIDDFIMDIRLDSDAKKLPNGKFVGTGAVQITQTQGVLGMGAFVQQVSKNKFNGKRGKALRQLALSIGELGSCSLSQLFGLVIETSVSYPSCHYTTKLFAQLVSFISSHLEKTHLKPGNVVHNDIATEDPDKGSLVPVRPDTILDPNNAYMTRSRLLAYSSATQNHMRSAQHLYIAGPDATTVGVDLNILLGIWMNCSTQKCAIAQPQDSIYLGFCK